MKARIKETGVLIDVIPKANPMAQSLGDNLYVCDNMVYRESELDFVNTQSHIDWEQRRFELVKAVSSGIMANTEYYKVIRDVCPYLRDDANKEKELTTYEVMAIEVRKFADAVLAEYRKGEKQ